MKHNSMFYHTKVLPTIYIQCLTGQPPIIEGFQAEVERNSKLLLFLTFLCEWQFYVSVTNDIFSLESFHQTTVSNMFTLHYYSWNPSLKKPEYKSVSSKSTFLTTIDLIKLPAKCNKRDNLQDSVQK